jgi:hypothetical protein
VDEMVRGSRMVVPPDDAALLAQIARGDKAAMERVAAD